MDFIEAVRKLEQTGQPIRRLDWGTSRPIITLIVLRLGYLVEIDVKPEITMPTSFSIEDILADDWELFWKCEGCGKWIPEPDVYALPDSISFYCKDCWDELPTMREP